RSDFHRARGVLLFRGRRRLFAVDEPARQRLDPGGVGSAEPGLELVRGRGAPRARGVGVDRGALRVAAVTAEEILMEDEEAARARAALLVVTEVATAQLDVAPQDREAPFGVETEVALFGEFAKDPRLRESPAADHDPRAPGLVHP